MQKRNSLSICPYLRWKSFLFLKIKYYYHNNSRTILIKTDQEKDRLIRICNKTLGESLETKIRIKALDNNKINNNNNNNNNFKIKGFLIKRVGVKNMVSKSPAIINNKINWWAEVAFAIFFWMAIVKEEIIANTVTIIRWKMILNWNLQLIFQMVKNRTLYAG